MRNKMYVCAFVVPAVALTWATVLCAMGENWAFSVLPGALAAGLFVGAWKVAHAESFSPQAPKRWESGTSAALQRWNQDLSDRKDAADAASKKPAPPVILTPPAITKA